jgi:two-component system, NarL family, response regulator DesR
MIRVLIAEDQAMVLGALAALIEIEPDLEVVGRAANGRDALDEARRLRPDVLVTDIAGALSLSEGTVRNYLSEAISKLGARNRVEAANLARAKGWL